MFSSCRAEVFVSIVVNCRELDFETFELRIRKLSCYLRDRFTDFEIILIDSQSVFEEIVSDVLKQVMGIRYIALVSDVDDHLARAAGFENSIGDVTISLSLKCDPLSSIDDVVDLILKGSDVVVGQARKNTSLLYKIASLIFAIICKFILGYRIKRNVSQLKGFSRRSLNRILYQKRHLSQMYYSILKNKYDIKYYYYKYDILPSSRGVLNGLRESFQVLVLNSTRLLRIFNIAGLIGASFALFISLYVFIVNVIKSNVAPGWTSIMLFVSVQFCVLFLVLFIYGEYLARLVDERWEVREYDVFIEKSSSVMIDEERRNVFTQEQI